MSQALFIPVFFIAAGFLVDFKVFFGTLSHQPLLVLGVLVALFGGKWLAAEAAGRWLGYGRPERDLDVCPDRPSGGRHAGSCARGVRDG